VHHYALFMLIALFIDNMNSAINMNSANSKEFLLLTQKRGGTQ
jgi:hypothetical protein